MHVQLKKITTVYYWLIISTTCLSTRKGREGCILRDWKTEILPCFSCRLDHMTKLHPVSAKLVVVVYDLFTPASSMKSFLVFLLHEDCWRCVTHDARDRLIDARESAVEFRGLLIPSRRSHVKRNISLQRYNILSETQ